MIPPYGCVPRAVLENTALSLAARLVYAELLALPRESDGTVIASYEQLAERLGISESTARRAVKALGREGLLEWRSGRRGRPNRYLPLEVIPGSRGVKPRVQELAVTAEPSTEREDHVRVVDAEAGDRAGVSGMGASRLAADTNVSDDRDRVRIARHGAEATPGGGR
jgi:predicted ArsR family transcriptional regulator